MDRIAERAYYKWEMAGRPENCGDKYYFAAKNEFDPPPYPKNVPTGLHTPYNGMPNFALVAADDSGLIYNACACKEYILDYTYYTVLGDKAKNPYGKCKAASLDEVKLFVGAYTEHLPKTLDLLHQVEDALGIPLSVAYKIRADLIYVGHKRWLIAPPMLSLYGLIIRSSRFHKIGDTYRQAFDKFWAEGFRATSYTDFGIWTGGKPFVTNLLKWGDQRIFGTDIKRNWPEIKSVAPYVPNKNICIHGRGVQATGTGQMKADMPHWYEHEKLAA